MRGGEESWSLRTPQTHPVLVRLPQCRVKAPCPPESEVSSVFVLFCL